MTQNTMLGSVWTRNKIVFMYPLLRVFYPRNPLYTHGAVMADDGAKQVWHATAVSWGQFLIALGAAVIGVLMAVVSDRIEVDRRLTIVEQQQRFADAVEAREAMEYSALRGAVDSKLTDIQRQLVVITIELAKHESAQNGDDNRRGLRLPK